MAAAVLEPGTRLLHIGPHKTGTTAIRARCTWPGSDWPPKAWSTPAMAGEGVVDPGHGRQPLWPILAVTGQPALLGGPRPDISYLGHLVREIRAAGDTARVAVFSACPALPGT